MVTISPFRVLNKVSVWAVEVEEAAVYRVQSTGTTIFPPSFAMFLSLKATLSGCPPKSGRVSLGS